jgi:RNA polymerase sigma-70 factor, ECF subfamily
MNPDPRERIEGALESLPEMFRIVVVMHDLEGFTHDEIGRTLGIPTGTSKARLSRARALLRPILSECAGDYALG